LTNGSLINKNKRKLVSIKKNNIQFSKRSRYLRTNIYQKSGTGKKSAFTTHQSILLLSDGFAVGVVLRLGPGRERVRPLDKPSEREEGSAGEDGGAPGVGVPAAVLPHGEPPLVPKSRRFGDRGIWRVRVPRAAHVRAAAAGQAGASDAALRRRGRGGLLLVVCHSGLY